MFALILPVCLADDPQICATRMLPRGASTDAAACRADGTDVSRAWLEARPELMANPAHGWACVDAASLPALTLAPAAPGVWLFRGADGQLSPDNRGRIANLSVVVGDDAVAVIDAGTTREQGEALLAAIHALTGLPVRYVVLTHMHPDHILGADVFAEAGAQIIADHRLPAALAARAATWADSIPRQIGAAAYLGTTPPVPARLIDAPETLDLGGASLRLTPVRAAHTDSDLTAFEPRSGTYFPADLVFRGLTPVIDGSLRGWLSWLDLPAPHGTHLVIPGHGAPALTLAEVTAEERAYLTALRDAVHSQLGHGAALSAAVPAVANAMAPLAPGWADFDATTARNAATAYAEMEWD